MLASEVRDGSRIIIHSNPIRLHTRPTLFVLHSRRGQVVCHSGGTFCRHWFVSEIEGLEIDDAWMPGCRFGSVHSNLIPQKKIKKLKICCRTIFLLWVVSKNLAQGGPCVKRLLVWELSRSNLGFGKDILSPKRGSILALNILGPQSWFLLFVSLSLSLSFRGELTEMIWQLVVLMRERESYKIRLILWFLGISPFMLWLLKYSLQPKLIISWRDFLFHLEDFFGRLYFGMVKYFLM
jgi:hypothetical protein